MFKVISRWIRPARQKHPAPEPPTCFDTTDAFLAALHGHSEARSTWAETNALPDLRSGTVDIVIYAVAYATDDCSGPVLFTCQYPVIERAPWPLPAADQERLERITNEINTFFHR